jgi:dipeptidyl aminopeptidase/acylaminoacyl peptidase
MATATCIQAFRSSLFVFWFGCVCASTVNAADNARPIGIDDLLRIPRVGDVQLSPDGRSIAYTVATPNVATNEAESNLWIADTATGNSKQVTHTGRDRASRWSPDGRSLAFLSRRDGKSQVYVLTLGLGESRAVTRFPSDVETLKWTPDGRTLIFSAVVDPECRNDECLKASADRRGKGVRVYDKWPVRLALSWVDGLRSHLFAVPADGSAAPRDLTPGREFDVPSRQTNDGSVDGNEIAVSPDSKEICFAANVGLEPTGQSFSQLFRVSLEGGAPKQLTTGSVNNRTPAYSPDGKIIAYRAQLNGQNIGGDRARLMFHDVASGAASDRTATFDRSVSSFAWAEQGKSVYLIAEDEGQAPLYSLPISNRATPRIVARGFVGELSAIASGRAVAFTRSSLAAPAEAFFLSTRNAEARQLTRHTQPAMSTVGVSPMESFWFKSTDSTSVQALYIPPPRLDTQRKYPLLVLLHGGPETAWGDSWTYRWNAQVFAAAGYGVVMINRRGSTGYGQKFTDGVVNQWGGAPYQDVMTGVDATLARYSYLDDKKVIAAGASYGGYMANWLATHTGRFKAILSHAGVYDMTSMYAMDLHWFLEFEQNGTPWGSPASYKEWSPSTYASELGKFKTPMLVTTGERDYRVPYIQSLELYAALQRQGVESKLLVFPDEGHWILKPQNSKQWYDTVLEWISRQVSR